MSQYRRCPECRKRNSAEAETCSACGYRFLWRRSFGRKGYNRVTVYERDPGGPLQLLYWDRDGARRESLTNLDGVPIFDRADAELIARRISDGIEQARRSKATTLNQLVGTPERHTVGELFAQLHTDRADEWSKKWARDQRRYRQFWETTLRRRTDITEVTPALVARIVVREARAKRWSQKTQNHYLNSAVETWGYAVVHLKWLAPKHGLEAVRRHSIHVDNTEIAYETAEAHAVLAELPDVDLRAAVVGELSYVGGRRLNAIMTLPISCYRTETRIVPTESGRVSVDFGVLTFPAETDKASKRGEVYLFGPPKSLIEELIASPLCQASGLVFPRGDDLQAVERVELPQTDKKLRRALREAEQLAGVPEVRGRSFHAFNRTFATDAEDPRAASSQSGKTEETMRRIYRQPKPAEKAALAMQLDGLRREA
ncbi:MAG: zinc ribbon domain-containing protein [Gemmatimonadetes bacterium]|nr:zinc ribbon domain-containing protein [Gemmatimonadota bacterium]